MWLGSPSTAKSTAFHPRPGTRSTRAALGAWRPLSPTSCVHPMRAPPAAKLSSKNLNFFCHRRMPTAYILVSGFARICAAPNKIRGIGVSGGVCAACIFFRGPLARTAAVWYTHAVFDHGRGFGWDVRPGLTPGVSRNGPRKWKRAQQVNHQVEREAGWPDGRTVKGRKPRK